MKKIISILPAALIIGALFYLLLNVLFKVTSKTAFMYSLFLVIGALLGTMVRYYSNKSKSKI